MSRTLFEESEPDLEQFLVDLFSDNKVVEDTEVHALAEERGIDPDIVENSIYKILSSFMNGGRWNKEGRPDVDSDELSMGIKIEQEHAGDIFARRIALDHLTECKDYYTRLKKMESECE